MTERDISLSSNWLDGHRSGLTSGSRWGAHLRHVLEKRGFDLEGADQQSLWRLSGELDEQLVADQGADRVERNVNSPWVDLLEEVDEFRTRVGRAEGLSVITDGTAPWQRDVDDHRPGLQDDDRRGALTSTLSSEGEGARLEVRDGGVAVLTLLDIHETHLLMSHLFTALARCTKDRQIRVLVLRGSDEWFSAGGTIEGVHLVNHGQMTSADFSLIILELLRCPIPIISEMRGSALGGGLVLVLCTDFPLLSETGRYGATFVLHNITPGMASTGVLPERLGGYVGRRLLATGRAIFGADLAAMGCQTPVLPADEIEDAAMRLAEELAQLDRPILEGWTHLTRAEFRARVNAAVAREGAAHRTLFANATRPTPPASMDEFRAVDLRRDDNCLIATLYDEVLTLEVLEELRLALEWVEGQPSLRFMVLRREADVFCSGMDLGRAFSRATDRTLLQRGAAAYTALLERMWCSPVMTLVCVEGRVLAGGVGLVAAADWVVASARASVSLSEGLFGIVPAMAGTAIARRMGVTHARSLAMSDRVMSAEEAVVKGLFDEVSQDPYQSLWRTMRAMARVPQSATREIREFFEGLGRNAADDLARAANCFVSSTDAPEIRRRVESFTRDGRLPWDPS